MIVTYKVDGASEMFNTEYTTIAIIEMYVGTLVRVKLFVRSVSRKVPVT